MKRKWSEYMQLPELLEYTRQYMLTEEMRELIMNHMGIQDGDNILEVGCGTGYLCRYLDRGRAGLSLTGIDRDEDFLKEARYLAEKEGMNHITYLYGEAESLPFPADTFDHVVSHTFLTSTENPKQALKEMHRVVKPGGRISSITAMSLKEMALDEGEYPKECRFIERYRFLFNKVWAMYEGINPVRNYINASDSNRIPRMFVEEGLKEITLFPIGYAFSFSDFRLKEESRKRYLELWYLEEKKKFEKYFSLKESRQYLTLQEGMEYLELLKQKRDYLWEHIDDNTIFEWNGRANIMMTGRAEK